MSPNITIQAKQRDMLSDVTFSAQEEQLARVIFITIIGIMGDMYFIVSIGVGLVIIFLM